MIKILDPSWLSFFWTVFTFVAGLIGGFVRWITQRRKRKQMTSELKVNRAVLRFNESIKQDCKVTFGSNAQNVTNNIYWLTLVVKNTGSQAIMVNEYTNNTRIEIKFGANARVLDIEKKTPDRASVQSGQNYVAIDPLDLNPREALIVDVLVTDFTGEIEEERCLLNIEQILKVTIPSRPKLINNLLSLLALFIPLVAFFYISSFALTFIFRTPTLNAETNQVLGASVFIAGLVATLWGIGIFFLIHHKIPVSIYSKRQKLKISNARTFFATDNVISAFLLFVFSPLVFFFSKAVIMSNLFSFLPPLGPDVARRIDFSVLIGGFITTLLLIGINFLLGRWLPLREFDGD